MQHGWNQSLSECFVQKIFVISTLWELPSCPLQVQSKFSPVNHSILVHIDRSETLLCVFAPITSEVGSHEAIIEGVESYMIVLNTIRNIPSVPTLFNILDKLIDVNTDWLVRFDYLQHFIS